MAKGKLRGYLGLMLALAEIKMKEERECGSQTKPSNDSALILSTSTSTRDSELVLSGSSN
jgi:hypothetical protein